MGKKWKIDFVTQRNEDITVSIYKEGYSGDVIQVTGADNPLSLNEESDEDILMPSRGMTGHLEVIDDGQIEDIMPKNDREMYVTVEQGTELIWQGWVKSDQCTKSLYDEKSVVSLPLQDALMVMDSIDMDNDKEMGMETFGTLVREAMDATGAVWTAIVYPKEMTHGSGDYDAWMQIEVDRRNWFEKSDSSEDDPDYAKYERISYKQLLEKIATAMGWTVVVKGTELWFVTTQITAYERKTLAGVKSSISLNPQKLDDMDFSTDDSTVTSCNGVRQVSVKAFVNPIEEVEIGIETKGKTFVRRSTVSPSTDARIKMLVYEKEAKQAEIYSWTFTGPDSNRRFTAVASPYDPFKDTRPTAMYMVTQLVKADFYLQSEANEGNKKSYNYSDGIMIFGRLHPGWRAPGMQSTTNWVKIAAFSGSELPPLKDGCLDLGFDFDAHYETFGFKASCVLKVGKKYWDGNSKTWKSQMTAFDVQIENNRIKSNKTLEMLYKDAQNHVIPINSQIEGEVYLDIYVGTEFLYNVPYFGDLFYTMLKNVSLKYCEPENEDYLSELKDYNLLSAAQENGFTEKKKIETEVATKTEKCKNGLGILHYGGNLMTATTLKYQGTAMTIEKMLLTKMKKLLFRASQIISVTVECDIDSIPEIGEYFTWNTHRCIVIAREISFRDNDVMLTLITLA